MEFRIRSTGEVMMEGELRYWAKTHGGPSWDQTTDEVLEALGVDVIFEGPQAATTPPYEYSMREGIEQREDGKWYTKYVVGPVFVDTIERSAADQLTDYRARIDASTAESIRRQRNQLLTECDWTIITDSPVDKQAWTTYRQALRDLPTQPGFPHTITWPQKP